MKSVRDLLQEKGDEIWSIRPDNTVWEAIKLMAEKEIGAVVVLEGEQLVGIFSERDYARKIVLEGRSSLRTQVKVTMTGEVISIGIDGSVKDCISLMTNNRIRHLPVLEGDQLIGIISVGDVIKALISEQKTEKQ